MREEWRSVVGYEGKYEVSDTGRVKALTRPVWGGRAWYIRRGRIFKNCVSGTGYRMVGLCSDGVQKSHKVCWLVLEAFVGPRPAGYVACHGLGGRLDDSLENIEWGTYSKNNGEDRVRDGADNRGERCGASKLTSLDVRAIRFWVSSGFTQTSVAKKFNMSHQQISRIVRGKRWAHLEGGA